MVDNVMTQKENDGRELQAMSHRAQNLLGGLWGPWRWPPPLSKTYIGTPFNDKYGHHLCQGKIKPIVIVNITLRPQNPTQFFIVYINSSSRELIYCIALEGNIHTWYVFDLKSLCIFYFVNYLWTTHTVINPLLGSWCYCIALKRHEMIKYCIAWS